MHKDPFGGTLRYEVDRLFDHLVHTAWRGSGAKACACPPVTVSEDAAGYRIEMDVPGVVKEEVKVTSELGLLRIEGVRRRRQPAAGERTHLVEQCFGPFARTLRLPADAAADGIRAQLNDGVLTLEIPKRKRWGAR